MRATSLFIKEEAQPAELGCDRSSAEPKHGKFAMWYPQSLLCARSRQCILGTVWISKGTCNQHPTTVRPPGSTTDIKGQPTITYLQKLSCHKMRMSKRQPSSHRSTFRADRIDRSLDSWGSFGFLREWHRASRSRQPRPPAASTAAMQSWCGAEVAQGQPKAGQTENRNAAVMG